VLALNAIALVLAILLPGIGLALGWIIAAYAIGRGLFVAVAMRRMPRAAAESLYRSQRGVVLLNGAILAAAAYVPIINLLIPVIGTAAMVHVLDIALSGTDRSRPSPPWAQR
jgi:CysZ protein